MALPVLKQYIKQFFSKIILKEIPTPVDSPPPASLFLYFRNEKLYNKNSLGIERVVSPYETGSGGESAQQINTSASNNASGSFSHSEGNKTVASGIASHAEGNDTKAQGPYSHSEGNSTIASGDYSHAEGNTTTASNEGSHSEGRQTIASGIRSHAEGMQTTASGNNSHAEGSGSNASGHQAHAEGANTIASGLMSHAEGFGANASGNFSHAEGTNTIASNTNSHAEGEFTTASGYTSHVEGGTTIASGQYSHSEGKESIASNYASHAEGEATIAREVSSHAGGRYAVAYHRTEIARASGFFTTSGDVQTMEVVAFATTTSASSVTLGIQGSAADVNNRIRIPKNSSWYVHLSVLAVEGATGDTAAFGEKSVVIKNIGGTVTGINTGLSAPDFSDAGAASWTIDLIANNTTKDLSIVVTGESGKVIRWNARVKIIQTGYSTFTVNPPVYS